MDLSVILEHLARSKCFSMYLLTRRIFVSLGIISGKSIFEQHFCLVIDLNFLWNKICIIRSSTLSLKGLRDKFVQSLLSAVTLQRRRHVSEREESSFTLRYDIMNNNISLGRTRKAFKSFVLLFGGNDCRLMIILLQTTIYSSKSLKDFFY
jgi:hypothetical protein